MSRSKLMRLRARAVDKADRQEIRFGSVRVVLDRLPTAKPGVTAWSVCQVWFNDFPVRKEQDKEGWLCEPFLGDGAGALSVKERRVLAHSATNALLAVLERQFWGADPRPRVELAFDGPPDAIDFEDLIGVLGGEASGTLGGLAYWEPTGFRLRVVVNGRDYWRVFPVTAAGVQSAQAWLREDRAGEALVDSMMDIFD